ncbi:MAG: elongation factor EF-2, partial [Nanoarchaeota archaeon]
FEQVMKEGPLAREPGLKLKVGLVDTKLHEDAIHRGPAQVLPAVRAAIKGAILNAAPMIFEPVQILQIEAPLEFMGEISKLVQNKRGQLLEMNQEGAHITVKAKLPVGEMFGLSNDLRSATGGRGVQYLIDQKYEKLPYELQQKVITRIRERKGLKVDEDLAIQGE